MWVQPVCALSLTDCLAPSHGRNTHLFKHTHTHSTYLSNNPQPLLVSPSLPNYANTLTLLVMSVWSEWQPALLCLLFHTHIYIYIHTHICLLGSGWISSLWFTRAPSHCSPIREQRMYGAETWNFNDLESTQTLYAPTPFFFSFFHLLRNSGCHRPCRADLFVRQNSRDLAEKHHQADSQRVSPGGGVVWTPTRDILLRWRAVNKHALPQGFANQGTEGKK